MARAGKSVPHNALLTAALEGLELQKQRVDQQIAEVRSMLGEAPRRRGRPPGSGKKAAAAPQTPRKSSRKRELSSAARKRIAAAQKRRWAEYRKQTDGPQE
jgi:hypothetical protein